MFFYAYSTRSTKHVAIDGYDVTFPTTQPWSIWLTGGRNRL